MATDSSTHWKAGAGFVLACVAVGTLLAVFNTSGRNAREQSGFEDTEPNRVDSDVEALGDSNRSGDDLSYQEQLQRNGDVDGRSKDYFTPDGDGEFGGAVIGMDYDDFRDRLRFAGFVPTELEKPAECNENPDYADCNYRYPETESCSGTGEAFCLYLWHKGDDEFMVLTREGEGGQVVEMSYIR